MARKKKKQRQVYRRERKRGITKEKIKNEDLKENGD